MYNESVFVIGRRNWTFAGSDRGAENAATIMTIIETAKLCGLNPQTYPGKFTVQRRV
jgi:transposase